AQIVDQITVRRSRAFELTDPRMHRLIRPVVAEHETAIPRPPLKRGCMVHHWANNRKIAQLVVADRADCRLIGGDADAQLKRTDLVIDLRLPLPAEYAETRAHVERALNRPQRGLRPPEQHQ